MRHTIKEVILNKNVFGSIASEGYEADTIGSVIQWLESVAASIPEEHRANAKFEIESVGGYEGEHHAEITVWYYRDETDAEMKARHRGMAARADESERLAAMRLADAKRMREQLAKEQS